MEVGFQSAGYSNSAILHLISPNPNHPDLTVSALNCPLFPRGIKRMASWNPPAKVLRGSFRRG